MREEIFQYLWQHLAFDVTDLQTFTGQAVGLEFQGERNDGDGPDFKRARIRIDELWFFGDVELHIHNNEWFRHGHDQDPAYNSVILHVVLEPEAASVPRQDGTLIPTLCLEPYLSVSVLSLLRQKQQKTLPCSPQVRALNPSVIEHQMRQAQKEYFDYRTDQLMQFYPASVPPFEAWKTMTTLALFEGLGYSNNREPMVGFGRDLLGREKPEKFSQLHKDKIREWAGLSSSQDRAHRPYSWDFSSSRPANQPHNRVVEAVALAGSFWEYSYSDYLHLGIRKSWSRILAGCSKQPGATRTRQLWQAVWLPAMYLMGSLCASDALLQNSYELWLQESGGVPGKIQQTFTEAGFEAGRRLNHPGTVYQYKHYCRQLRCSECSVMKNILNA